MDDITVIAARIESHLAQISQDIAGALEKIERHLYITSIAQMYIAQPNLAELRETIGLVADLLASEDPEGSHT